MSEDLNYIYGNGLDSNVLMEAGVDEADILISVMEKDEQNGMSPVVIGKHIAKLALKKRVKVLSSFGLGYRCICVLGKLLPCCFVNFLVRMLYAK